jgi:chemotaxis protein methyltransferase CheR
MLKSQHAPDLENALIPFLDLIKSKYHYDFRQYSPASLKRRVNLAMLRLGSPNLKALGEKVLGDSDSFYELLQTMTVSVSEMFRDPTYFRALRERVFPQLRAHSSLKIWVAGCSTGEEVYSLAIMLHEEELLERSILYATDINPKSLESAERGVFDLESMRKFTRNYQKSGGKKSLSDYYTASFDSAKFSSALKKNITFADHCLATDSVFTETQLISCRNVLIYFDHDLQDKVLGLFHQSLCESGFLGLGPKETVQFSSVSRHFDSVVNEDRIFQKVQNG